MDVDLGSPSNFITGLSDTTGKPNNFGNTDLGLDPSPSLLIAGHSEPYIPDTIGVPNNFGNTDVGLGPFPPSLHICGHSEPSISDNTGVVSELLLLV